MRFLPSLLGGRPVKPEVKGAVERRHSAGSYYTFEGTPTVSPAAGAFDPETAIRDAWGRVIWVYRAIDARAKSASRLNVKIMDGRGDDATEIPDHNLAYLLNRRANAYESGQAFRYRLSTLMDLSLLGVPVEVVEKRNGDIDSLHILNPQITKPIPDPDRFLEGWEMRLPNGEVSRLPVYQRGEGGGVLWFRRPHPTDPYASSTWLQAAGISIDLDFYARQYNLRFLQNDGRPGGVIAVKGEDGIDAADAVELQRRMSGGPDSAGKVTIVESEGGLEYHDLATNARDAQYVESRALTQREILVAAGTPLSVIGDASGRTFDNADAEMESFWRIEMIPECDLLGSFWEELTDDGPGGDTEVVTYDYDSITVLQRDKRAREQAKQAEVSAGLVSIDEYRESTNQKPLDIPGSRVLWLPAGKAPIGDDADVVALLSQGQGGAPPPDGGAPAIEAGPVDPNAPADGEVVEPGNPNQDAVPAVLDEAQYAEQKALPKDGPGDPADSLIEARRKAHAELIDAWETALAKELIALCHRQEQVILARLKGAKARRHTRHWEGVDLTREVKALDPAYIADRRTWIDHVVSAIADVVKAAFGASGDATAEQLGSEWKPGPEAAGVIAKTVRAIAEGFDARAGRLQDIIETADKNGDDIKTIAEKVKKAFTSAPTWAQVESRSVVGAMNAASLIAAVDAGALEKRWLATDDERTRPSHVKAEGQVVAIDEPFKVGKGELDFPGDPSGPPAEWVNCRCTMLFAVGAGNPEEDLDEDLKALDEFEWKAARAFRVVEGVDVRFDPHDHPRDYRGRFVDVPDVTLPDGTRGVAVSQDTQGNVTVAKADGDVVTVNPATLTQDTAPEKAHVPTYQEFTEGATESDIYTKRPDGAVTTVTAQDDGTYAWSAWAPDGTAQSGTAPDRVRAEGRASNAANRLTGVDRDTRGVGFVTTYQGWDEVAKITDVRHGVEFISYADDTAPVIPSKYREWIGQDVDAVLADLPDLKPPTIDTKANADAFAQAGGWPNPRISIGRIYGDDNGVAAYSKDWSNGLSIAGGRDQRDTRRAVVTHEMGHNIKRQIERTSPEGEAEIDAFVNELVTPASLGYEGGVNLDKPRLRWTTDSLSTSDHPRDHQSIYANESSSEWFAEAFADGFLNGDQASPSGKRALALARRHLGGVHDTREGQAVNAGQAGADREGRATDLVSAPPAKQPPYTTPEGQHPSYRGIILDAYGGLPDPPSDQDVLDRLRRAENHEMFGSYWSDGFQQAEDFSVGEAQLSYVWSMGAKPSAPVWGVVLEAQRDNKPGPNTSPFVLSGFGEDAVAAPSRGDTHKVLAHLYRMDPGPEPRKRTYVRTIEVPTETWKPSSPQAVIDAVDRMESGPDKAHLQRMIADGYGNDINPDLIKPGESWVSAIGASDIVSAPPSATLEGSLFGGFDLAGLKATLDAMPDGPDKEGFQRLYDSLNRHDGFAAKGIDEQRQITADNAIQAAMEFHDAREQDPTLDPIQFWYGYGKPTDKRDLPAYAITVINGGLLDDTQAGKELAAAAWQMPEWPEGGPDMGEHWREAFEAVGFFTDADEYDTPIPQPTGPVTLYRGSSERGKRGMAWTSDKDTAYWFASRFGGSAGGGPEKSVWTTTVDGSKVYGILNGRGEHEHIVDTRGATITKDPGFDPDRVYGPPPVGTDLAGAFSALDQRLVDYKPDRDLTDPEATRLITDVLPGVEETPYSQTPFIDELHALMGVEDPMTVPIEEYVAKRDALFTAQPITQVPFDNVTVTQARVNTDRVQQIIDHPETGGSKPQHFVRYQGRTYVMNGHHRVVAQIEGGDTSTRGHVLDLDAGTTSAAPAGTLPDETFDKVRAALASLPAAPDFRMWGREVFGPEQRREQALALERFPEKIAVFDKAITANEKALSLPPSRHPRTGQWVGQPIYWPSKNGLKAEVTGYLIPQEAVDDGSWPGYSQAARDRDLIEVVTPRGKPIKPDMVMTPKGSSVDYIQDQLTNNRAYAQHRLDKLEAALAAAPDNKMVVPRDGGPTPEEVKHLDTVLEVGHSIYLALPSVQAKQDRDIAYEEAVHAAADLKNKAIELSDRLHDEFITKHVLHGMSVEDYHNLVRGSIPAVMKDRTEFQNRIVDDINVITDIPYDWQTSQIRDPLKAVAWQRAAQRALDYMRSEEGWAGIKQRIDEQDPTLPDYAQSWTDPEADLPDVVDLPPIGAVPQELHDAIYAYKAAARGLGDRRIAKHVEDLNAKNAIHAEVAAALAQIRDVGGAGIKVRPEPVRVSMEYGPDAFTVGADNRTKIRPAGIHEVDGGPTSTGMTTALSEEIKGYLESGSRVYPTDWVEASNVKHGGNLEGGGLIAEVTSRAYYSGMGNKIALSGHNADYLHTTAVHEIGHTMEAAVPGLEQMEWAMLWHRTHDQQADGTWVRKPGDKYLNDTITPGEYGIRDDWKNRYTGKVYGDSNPDAMPYANSPKEMFTTIVQGLLGGDDPYEYGDDEMNAWALGLLATLGTPDAIHSGVSTPSEGGDLVMAPEAIPGAVLASYSDQPGDPVRVRAGNALDARSMLLAVERARAEDTNTGVVMVVNGIEMTPEEYARQVLTQLEPDSRGAAAARAFLGLPEPAPDIVSAPPVGDLTPLYDLGEGPIPDGTIRLYHYTDLTNADSVKRDGLLESRARGDGGMGAGNEPSAGVWASTRPPDFGADSSKAVVEFWARPDQISGRADSLWRVNAGLDALDDFQRGNHHVIMNGDVPTDQFVQVHEPWQAAYRYMKENKDPLAEFAWVMDEPPGPPYDTYKQAYRRLQEEAAQSDVVSAPPVGDVDGWLRARALRDGRRVWERDDPPEYWVDNALAKMPRPQTVATTGDTTVAVMGKSKGPGGRRTIPFDQAKVQTLLTHAEWLRTNLPTDEAVPVEVVVRPPGKWENEDWAMRASRGQSQELGAIVIGVNQDEAMGPFWHDDVAEKANFPAGNALMPSARGLPDSVYSLTHEWGHVHDNRTKAQVVEDEQILTDPGLSDYGRYHSHEAYAEAYAEWVHTGGQSTNSAVLYFAQKYGWAIPEATP